MASKPWWQVVRPHKDIREGKLDEAVFAADLGDVINDRGPIDYRDAETFFQKTYLTKGLENLLGSVLMRLAGDSSKAGAAPSVIQLQTPFGGGKTHALLALYHIMKNWDTVSHLPILSQIPGASGLKGIPQVQVAAFVGTDADPLHGRTPWGEIAHQIDKYELVKEHDERRVAPGKNVIVNLLGQSQPLLILVDELLQYVVKAAGVKVEQGTLKGQVLAFLQELTTTVSTLDHCALLITLPSSILERYDEAAEEALTQLQKISGRVETIFTPVEGVEIYEVIRKRLFEDLGNIGTHKLVAEEYFNFYQKLGEDIPSETKEIQYRERMVKAYPFHPELIDLLFERWGTIATFQRTRGVLRLLAKVVADLHKKEHPSPVIQPAHVNLANSSIRREFIKHIGNQFEGVIASDIDGEGAKAPRIDREMGSEYTQYKVAAGLATSIFLYSFSGGEKKGVTLPRLRLSFLREGIPHTIVGDAINRLVDDLWFLHPHDSLYRFSSQPNLNRVIVDKEEAIGDQQVEAEIRERISKICGPEFEVYLWPQANSDIPDNKRLKLAILAAHYSLTSAATPQFLDDLITKYGVGFRTYKNALIFLVPDSSEYEGLKKMTRRFLALEDIKENKELVAALSEENKRSLEQKFKDAESSVPTKIISAYRHLAKASSEGIKFFDMGIPTLGEKASLTRRVKQYLKDEEKFLDRISAKYVIEKTFGKKVERKSFGEIWQSFLQYPDLPILAHEEVLKRTVIEGVKDKSLGLEANGHLYFGDDVAESMISDEVAILRPELTQKLIEDLLKQKAESEEPQEPTIEAKIPTKRIAEKQEPDFPEPVGGLRKIRIRAQVPWDRLSSFISGVLGPLQQEGAQLFLEVSLSAESEKGISKDTLELKVKETLNQIGAEILEWPEE